MRRKVDTAICTLPPSCSLTQFEIALLNQGIELELIPDKEVQKFKGIAYRFHQYRFAGSALRSGNKYTLGKLIENRILANSALNISNYEKHHAEILHAQEQFNTTRRLAITYANEVRRQIEDYDYQRYRYLLLTFKKATEAQEQFEHWCEYARRIHITNNRAVVRAIYECERGIYRSAGSMSTLFYHILLTIFEFSLMRR